MRPEALRGRAYARLARPGLLEGLSLRMPLAVALFAAVSISVLVIYLPISTTYTAYGFVANKQASSVVRAPKTGQLVHVAPLGTDVPDGGVVGQISQAVMAEGGRDPRVLNSEQLRQLTTEREAALRLIEEKFDLSMLQLINREHFLEDRIKVSTSNLRTIESLSEQAQRLSDAVNAEPLRVVSKLDALGISDKAATLKNREFEIRSELDRTKSDLLDIASSKRILTINKLRDRDETRRQFAALEASLLERSGALNMSIPSHSAGRVLATYKQAGEWVNSGDEIALIGPPNQDAWGLKFYVPVSADIANLIKIGQTVRIWVNAHRKGDSPVVGRLVALDRSGEYREQSRVGLQKQQTSSFVAVVELEQGNADNDLALKTLRIESQVEVEIVLGVQRLYEALLPNRLTRNAQTL